MNKILCTAAVAAMTLAATPAAAQEATAGASHDGARVELLAGVEQVRVNLGDFGDAKDEGIVFGVGAGYDFAVSSAASVGVDVEVSDSSTKEGEDGAEVSTGIDLYAGGRVTFPVSSAANLYLKGGYTNFRVKGEVDDESDSEALDGWRVGAGGQFKIGDKAYVGGEYRYSDYQYDVSKHQFVVTIGARF